MATRADIVEEARSWIGTPFHHQASLKGVGVDCVGLIRGIMVAKNNMPEDFSKWPSAYDFLGYDRVPDGKKMMEACNLYLTVISKEDMQPGDIVLVSFDKHPQHVGVLGDYRHGGLSIIHASGDSGKVIETRLMFSGYMKFVAAYAFPEVE